MEHSERHLHACTVVCRRCGRKTNHNRVRLTSTLRDTYTTHFGHDVRFDQEGLPTAICSGCYSHLRKLAAAGDGATTAPRTSIPQCVFRSRPVTRLTATTECAESCEICRAAYAMGRPVKTQRKRKDLDDDSQMTDSALSLCSKCFSTVGAGRPHDCNKRAAVANLDPLLVDLGIDGHLAARAIDRRASGETASLPRFSRPKEVFVKRPPKPDGGMDLLFALKQSRPGTSDAHASRMRKTLSSFVTTPSMAKYRSMRQDVVGELFEAVQLPLRRGSKYDDRTTPTWVVRCTDICELIDRWYPQRRGERLMVKIGIDSGQGLLKVTLEVMTVQSNSTAALLVIAITPATECSETIRVLLHHPAIDRLFRWHDAYVCGDMKVMHLMTGTMMNGTCGCPLCTWQKNSGYYSKVPPAKQPEHRTMQRLQTDFDHLKQKMEATGKPAKDLAKAFFSQEAPPALPATFNLPLRMALPQVHLSIGIVSKFHLALTGGDLMNDDEKKRHEEALKRAGIMRSRYFPNTFEGRHAKKLLWNLPKLELCPNEKCIPIYKALEAFAEVERTCFRVLREPDFVEKIREFRQACEACGESVSPKMHLLDDHVIGFLLQFTEPAYGLGFFSEQALESAHQKFKQTWLNWNFSEATSGYEKALKAAVLDFNLERMGTEFADILYAAMNLPITPQPE